MTLAALYATAMSGVLEDLVLFSCEALREWLILLEYTPFVYQPSPTVLYAKGTQEERMRSYLMGLVQCGGPVSEAEAATNASGGGHGSWRLFRIPSSAAIKTHVLEDHHACLQVDRRFGSQTTLASLAALYVCCPL